MLVSVVFILLGFFNSPKVLGDGLSNPNTVLGELFLKVIYVDSRKFKTDSCKV